MMIILLILFALGVGFGITYAETKVLILVMAHLFNNVNLADKFWWVFLLIFLINAIIGGNIKNRK